MFDEMIIEARLKAQKEEEKNQEYLKKEIKLYEDFLSNLISAKKVAEKFSDKVVNARMIKALNEIDIHMSVHYGESIYLKPYGRLQWLCVIQNAIVNKRLDYDKFCKDIDKNIESIQNVIANIKEDLKTGHERREKFNEMMEELEKLSQTFSEKYKEIYKYNFKRAIYSDIN